MGWSKFEKRVLLTVIEYDCRGGRRRKEFRNDPFAARRFYSSKDRDGKNPKIVKVER